MKFLKEWVREDGTTCTTHITKYIIHILYINIGLTGTTLYYIPDM